ncbi:class I SAM-dependent methyltransferase [Sporosarcina sp. CAU 1771]
MGEKLPALYDIVMKPLEKARLTKIRKKLIQKAEGRVLEIGSGTGINFSHYTNATQVDAIEPSTLMSDRSMKRLKAAEVPIELHTVSAEELPFEDNMFDTIVATLVFCTIPDPVKALNEIYRVSKKGAKFYLIEHVRMDYKGIGKIQDVLTPVWRKVADGCHLNRDTLALLEQSRFTVREVETFYGKLFLHIECIKKV